MVLVDLDYGFTSKPRQQARPILLCLHLCDKYQYLIKWLIYHFLMSFTIISAKEYFLRSTHFGCKKTIFSEAMGGHNDLCTRQPCDIN